MHSFDLRDPSRLPPKGWFRLSPEALSLSEPANLLAHSLSVLVYIYRLSLESVYLNGGTNAFALHQSAAADSIVLLRPIGFLGNSRVQSAYSFLVLSLAFYLHCSWPAFPPLAFPPFLDAHSNQMACTQLHANNQEVVILQFIEDFTRLCN